MQTVGELLRAAREKKGLEIKDVENAISIRALYLTAIEESDYEVLPGEVYLKGFIRNYANFLELDSQEMLNMYNQSKQAPAPSTVEMTDVKTNVTAKIAAEVQAKEPASVTEKLIQKREASRGSVKRYITIALLLSAAGGLAWWYNSSNAVEKKNPNLTTNQTTAAPAQPAKTTQMPPPAPGQTQNQGKQPAVPAAANNAADTPALQPTTKPVVVSAKFSERCWMSVNVDGKQVYEGTAQKGETLTWQGDKDVVIRMGNAGAVDIICNGKSAGKIGDAGEVAVKTFTAANTAKN